MKITRYFSLGFLISGMVAIHSSAAVFTTLISFNATNGASPSAALVQGQDGNFYGTTGFGGSAGDGTVFQMTPSGTLNSLFSFSNTNGADPRAGLVLAADGYFYGTTYNGGSNNAGTVFQVTTNGTSEYSASFCRHQWRLSGGRADPRSGRGILRLNGDWWHQRVWHDISSPDQRNIGHADVVR